MQILFVDIHICANRSNYSYIMHSTISNALPMHMRDMVSIRDRASSVAGFSTRTTIAWINSMSEAVTRHNIMAAIILIASTG
jgi:hypothetical protein